MSDERGGSGWASVTLIVLGVILAALGIAVCAFVGYCTIQFSGFGSHRSFLDSLPLMFVFGGPILTVGGVLLTCGIAMRRGPPQ